MNGFALENNVNIFKHTITVSHETNNTSSNCHQYMLSRYYYWGSASSEHRSDTIYSSSFFYIEA